MFPSRVLGVPVGRWLGSIAVLALVATGTLGLLTIQRDREFSRLVGDGAAASARGDLAGAIEAYSGALALRPDSMLAHFRRGEAYRRRGDLPLALRDLRRATELDPAAVRPLEALGDVHQALGRYDAAADRYQHALAKDERAPVVWYKLAVARWRLADASAALQALRQARTLGWDRPEASYLEGLCLIDSQQNRLAIAALRHAVDLDPAFKPARHELQRLYGRLNRQADQVTELQALVALEPGNLGYHLNLARRYAALGQPETARLTLSNAATRFPGSAAIELATGIMLLDDFERARTRASLADALAILGALAAVEPSSRVLAQLGRGHLAAGRPRQALSVLTDAVRARPVEPLALEYLAEAARRLGDRGEEAIALSSLIALQGTSAQAGVRVARDLRLAALARESHDLEGERRYLRRAAGTARTEHVVRTDELRAALIGAGLHDEASAVATPGNRLRN